MKWTLFVVSGFLGWLIWWGKPPKEVVGSYLRDFDSAQRRRAMIRHEEEQNFTLFH